MKTQIVLTAMLLTARTIALVKPHRVDGATDFARRLRS